MKEEFNSEASIEAKGREGTKREQKGHHALRGSVAREYLDEVLTVAKETSRAPSTGRNFAGQTQM